MADTHIAVEALRTTLWQLAYRIDAGLPAPSEALATAWLACEAGHRIGHIAQHVHGGIGVDLTYPIHRFLYWSRGLSLALGGSAANLERLGDWLNDNDKLGWKYDLEEHQAL
jgi:alkylation response protein AidB-like acyl-CoA dehydrogenase